MDGIKTREEWQEDSREVEESHICHSKTSADWLPGHINIHGGENMTEVRFKAKTGHTRQTAFMKYFICSLNTVWD